MACDRLSPHSSSRESPKRSEMIAWIFSIETSLDSPCGNTSFKTSWASSTVIGRPVSELNATTRVSAPSSSRMFVETREAMNVSSSGSRISTNIRELEGALTRVVAFSSLTGRALSVELAEDVLKDVFPQGEASEVSIEKIQAIISERFGLSLEELCGDKRSQAIVYPRQVAMYLSRELTDSSLPKIGREFGGRDHTTVIHATSKIQRLIREDRAVYNLVQELTARIKQMR